MTTPSKSSWPSIRKPRWLEAWSSECVDGATCRPTELLEVVSSFDPRLNSPYMEYARRRTIEVEVFDLEALTRAIEGSGD